MAKPLRGGISGEHCWFISMLPEYVLATTIIGIIPVGLVLILYSIILYRALKKVGELKKATSRPGGTEVVNNLRYFRGSAANLSQLHEHESTVPLAPASQKRRRCFCWQSEVSSSEAATARPSNRQPSKWKAIKIVFLTTGSFVITWVPYFVASTMYVYCDHENNPSFCEGLKVAIASPLAILGFANSLLNPIIYAWWHNGFRTNSKRILCRRLERMSCCQRCFNKSAEQTLSPRTTNLSSTTNLSFLSPTGTIATSRDDSGAADGSDLHENTRL